MAFRGICSWLLKEKMTVGKFFHTSSLNMASSQTASLAKLRKMTGYSMSNCKKALQLHPEDLSKAEEWLHEEARKQGWSKIANLEHKPAVQGLVGVHIQGPDAVMVEVNCETDFVARNTEFQSFVSKVLGACLSSDVGDTSYGECIKRSLSSSQLSSLKVGSTTLGDLTASAIGKFGEKTVIRRAVYFRGGQNVFLSSFSHPSTSCDDLPGASLGRYGGIIAYRPAKTSQELDKAAIEEIGKQLCQHVVGMSPESIGTLPDDEPEKQAVPEQDYGVKIKVADLKEDIIVREQQADEESSSEDEETDEKMIDPTETRLLRQQFLLDPTITVGEIVQKNSLEILDFHRFECGEPDNA